MTVALHRHALEVRPVRTESGTWRCWESYGPPKVDGDCDYCRAGIPREITYEWRGVTRPEAVSG